MNNFVFPRPHEQINVEMLTRTQQLAMARYLAAELILRLRIPDACSELRELLGVPASRATVEILEGWIHECLQHSTYSLHEFLDYLRPELLVRRTAVEA